MWIELQRSYKTGSGASKTAQLLINTSTIQMIEKPTDISGCRIMVDSEWRTFTNDYDRVVAMLMGVKP